MSMYLFDEHPIIANKTLAREIGLNEALILQQINYWIEIKKKTGKTRFLELRENHIEHLIEVLKTHDTEVRNIGAFILTAAYNVLSTIDSYYTNKVAYDTRHIKDLQSKNIKLNKSAKQVHQEIETLDKKILYAKLYKQHKELYKKYKSKNVLTKDSFYKAHKKEIDQFENVKNALENMIGVNGTLDPKKWEKEIQVLKQKLQDINTQKIL